MTDSSVNVNNQLINIVSQWSAPIAILTGPDHKISLLNEKMLAICSIIKQEDVLNSSFYDAAPCLSNLNTRSQLDAVYTYGIGVTSDECEIRNPKKKSFGNRYVKFIYEPLRDEKGKINGIMVIAHDITEQVEIRKKIEDNEEQLKIAVETAGLGAYSWEIANPKKLYFSQRMARIFGFDDTKEVTVKDISDRIHPDDAGIREAAMKYCYETGILKYEARIIWPDQSIHWISVRGKLIFNEEHVPVKLYGSLMDITVQKQTAADLENKISERTLSLQNKNEELARSEEKYQKMTEEVKDYAIILLSPEGIVLNWNKGAENIKGYAEKEILGSSFRIFYSKEDQKAKLPEKLLKEASINGRAIHEGYRIKKDGTRFWASIVQTALRDENENIFGFTKVTHDLSDKKIAEDNMKAYTRELEFQNKELEQFAFIASHDLQEPLRMIRMYAQLLEHKIKPDTEGEVYLSKINKASSRMQDLIKSVLHYSILLTNNEEFTKTDLNVILNNVNMDLELLIHEKNAVIESDHLPVIDGIPLQLQQLFSNLISNSLKFSKEQPIIQIRSKLILPGKRSDLPFLLPLKTYNQLDFIDNGIGFEQQYAERIFEVFQRLHEKNAYSGTGIGLALCRKIVVKHNGFITAQSRPGSGSVFSVYLPLLS